MHSPQGLEIASVGPFLSPIQLELQPGITCICGGNGAGKTSLARAIHARLGEMRQAEPVSALPKWITFCIPEDAGFQLPYGGIPWPCLREQVSGIYSASEAIQKLETEASCGLQELLEHKIRSGSKFSGSVRESREITVSISPNWVVNLSSSSGEDLNWAFQAWEERFALFLALNRAVRRVAGCARSTPLIVDGELGMYPDPVLRLTIRPFLDSLSEQVVVLDRCGTIARLGLTPHFVIVVRHALPRGERPTHPLYVFGQTICEHQYDAGRDESIVVKVAKHFPSRLD